MPRVRLWQIKWNWRCEMSWESGGCAVWFDIALTPELDFTPELHTETRSFGGHLLSEIWTSGLWSWFGGDGCLSSTQGHDRSLSALLGKGLIWWGCWHLPEGEGCRYWLMMIRCCEELNKMISKVSSCSQTAVDVWLVSAYGIPTLVFFLKNLVDAVHERSSTKGTKTYLHYFYQDKSLKLHMQMMPNETHMQKTASVLLDQSSFTLPHIGKNEISRENISFAVRG